MKTLGVDLASQPEATAVAVIHWVGGRASLEHLACGADDAEILRLAKGADAIGIDAPFGWPTAFRDLVERRAPLGAWDAKGHRRDELRYRRTDWYVKENVLPRRWPLSVSSDLIAIPAMRCQGLLDALKVTDRSGDGRVFEVYPRAGLSRWGLTGSGYKRPARGEARRSLWEALRAEASWLDVPSADDDARAARSHDAFDAVVAAMIVRAAAIGDVEDIPEREREAARHEGWIAVPRAGSLARLPIEHARETR